MSLNDTLANALSLILIDEKAGRKESAIKPSSKIIKKVLEIMKENSYVGDFEEMKDAEGIALKLNLFCLCMGDNASRRRYNQYSHVPS